VNSEQEGRAMGATRITRKDSQFMDEIGVRMPTEQDVINTVAMQAEWAMQNMNALGAREILDGAQAWFDSVRA
jgi:hypothetical protein